MSYKETLEGLLKRARTDARRAELEAELTLPPFPVELGYLWHAFLAIRRRKGGGWGITPIDYPDVVAYSQAMELRLRPWEIQAIIDLDDLFLVEVNKATPNEGQ